MKTLTVTFSWKRRMGRCYRSGNSSYTVSAINPFDAIQKARLAFAKDFGPKYTATAFAIAAADGIRASVTHLR